MAGVIRLTELSTGLSGALLLWCAAVWAGQGALAAGAPPHGPDAPDRGAGPSLQARAEAGDTWAQLNLGAAFDHGLAGRVADPGRAVLWYRRAAEAGVAEAQFNLAHCLATGHGTPRDDRAAHRWMRLAAAQGLADAEFLLGIMLAEGIGTPRDSTAARAWLQKAADRGHADAATALPGLPAAD